MTERRDLPARPRRVVGHGESRSKVMLRGITGALGAVGALAMTAPTCASDLPQTAATPTIRFAIGARSSGWIPFEFFPGNRIFIPALINGRPTSVMLDSGASSTVLDRRFASSLGLTRHGDLIGQGAGGAASYSQLHGVTVTLGHVAIVSDAAVALDLAPVEKQLGHPLSAALGGEAFRDLVVDIDFKRHRIAFRNPVGYRPPDNAQSVPLFTAGENRAIMATVEGQPARLVFDLGNGSPLLLFPRFWDKPAFSAGRRITTAMSGGWGGMGAEGLTMIHALTIGGGSFRELPAKLEDLRSADARSGDLDGNLGMPVFDRFHLIADFGRGCLWLAPPVETTRAFAINHTGLTLQPGAGGARILHVAPGSPAEAAGLAVGDIVLSVDGVKGNGRGVRQTAWLSSRAGTIVRLHLADGRTRSLTTATYF